MPKIHDVRIEIVTGERGHAGPVVFEFNGHPLPMRPESGNPEAGQTFVGSFSPDSVAHSVTLLGPEASAWDIERLTVGYRCADGRDYEVRFGRFTLDADTAADIWEGPPPERWEV